MQNILGPTVLPPPQPMPAGINHELLRLANTRLEKQAFQPGGAAAPPPDPSGMPPGGMPPGGAPPGMPPGGAPAPMPDPTQMQAAPPPPATDPNMGGMMPGMPGAAPAAPQKIKPEQMMQMLDFRLYNMQQQLTAIMNSLGIQLPPDALVLPPGSPVAPPAEAALPGGPMDSGAGQQQPQGGGDPAAAGGGGGGGGQSSIPPIEPIQGAVPQKTASDLMVNGQVCHWEDEPERAVSYIGDPVAIQNVSKAAALAALYRSMNTA